MIVLPNMGLVKWDAINDYFSHEQLAANFQALDGHDHTSGKGKPVSAGGLAENAVEPKNLNAAVYEQLGEHLGNESILTANIHKDAVTSAKIADGTVTDTDLASPNNSVYRIISDPSPVMFFEKSLGGVYLFSTPQMFGPGPAGILPEGGHSFYIFNFNSADYTVAGKTPKMRVRSWMACNATKPTIKFTFGLYPVSVTGSEVNLEFTPGTVVTGSTVEFNEPAATSITTKTGTDFAIPGDGTYALGVALSTKANEKAFYMVGSRLQLHWV